jgi:LysM repeat protein
MRNVYLFLIALVAVLLISACGSKPAPIQPSEQTLQEAKTAIVAAPTPSPVADSSNRHASGIILNGAQQYTVQSGDTLAQIAKRYYTDGAYYPLIMMVSEDVVKDPDEIQPGAKLTVPALRENLNDSRAKESLNRYLVRVAGIEEQRGRKETGSIMRDHAK